MSSNSLNTILLILIPGILVIVSSYLIMQSMMKALQNTLRTELLKQTNQDYVKLKLGAYERLSLLLERTSLPAMIQKLSNPNMSAGEFKILMLHSINEEFNYNLSQQVYVSPQTWATIKIVREQTIVLIQRVEQKLPEGASSVEFSKELIEALKSLGEIPHEKGLQMIRGEIELLFN